MVTRTDHKNEIVIYCQLLEDAHLASLHLSIDSKILAIADPIQSRPSLDISVRQPYAGNTLQPVLTM